MKPWSYLTAFSLPITIFIAFILKGFWVFFPIVYVFGLVPLLELTMKPDYSNKSEQEEALALSDKSYDIVIYLAVPIQLITLLVFLWMMDQPLSTMERTGLILSFGLQCGSFGINVAHELGHRSKKYEQIMAQILLMTSLYMHFFIEHNRGHHKYVATPEDPATAQKNEWVYAFWWRSVTRSFLSAWSLEAQRLQRAGKSIFSWQNQMTQFMVIQLCFVLSIYLLFNLQVMFYFILSAIVGFLLLETVNYIEHYGLLRKISSKGVYERTQPWHSWNSDHTIGRLMLFELSRHSDHHFKSTRKYQILRHMDECPQMPTGYPGMMLLSLFPPLWMLVMNKRLKAR